MRTAAIVTAALLHSCCFATGTAPVTLVTAYFRLEHSKHSHSEYDKWAKNFFSISSHTVVFTSQELRGHVMRMKRNTNNTLVVTKYNSVFDVPCVMRHESSYSTWQHDIDPEKHIHHPAIYGARNSKICLVNEATDMNPFGSDYFMWIDIGSFRSTHGITKWPSRAMVSHVRLCSDDSMLFSAVSSPENLDKDYVKGTFYGGSIKAIKDYYRAFWEVHDRMLEDGEFVGKDQNVMSTIVRARMIHFALIHSYDHCDDASLYFQQFFAYDSEIRESCHNEVVNVTHWDGQNEAIHLVSVPSGFEGMVAYGVFMENDRYINGAVTVAKSIKRYENARRRYGMIAMYTDLDDRAKCILAKAGWELYRSNVLAPFKEGAADQFKKQYTKLRLWNFDQYSLIMYLDCDTLIMKPVDFLFDLMTGYELGAVGDAEPAGLRSNFNAGMMILRPDRDTLSMFMAGGPTLDYDPTMAEQAFLNAWYRERVVRFPYAYSLNTAFVDFEDNKFLWNGLVADSYIIHFTQCKPMAGMDCGAKINGIWKDAQVTLDEVNC